MLDTIVPQAKSSLSLRQAIAAQIRNECGAHGWSCIVLAEILQVSVGRARDLYAGRRPALLEELATLSTAADTTVGEFVEAAVDRNATPRRRIFADTTMTELAQIAGSLGVTPASLLKQQGWCDAPSASVPAYLRGDA
ncbi:hypothetical protein NVV95_11145 [Herbiconiux sp. CPCC 205716]|uniref:Uncharacterized protein n=1 Tax=Herbiconiux gentiana TaxID=2970912 RepID=A0ABT2GFZ2_9MICO|nr:hypothetical protein [Herbiconiux gentiana]MCS5715107.1 hypothetical protein [Herbiconiux gentiana]